MGVNLQVPDPSLLLRPGYTFSDQLWGLCAGPFLPGPYITERKVKASIIPTYYLNREEKENNEGKFNNR